MAHRGAWVLGAGGVVVAGAVAAFAAIAWRPQIAPISPPASNSFSPEVVKNGAVLAAAGDCAVCHTAAHGRMPRSCRRLRRATPAPHTPFVHAILQWRSHTSISEQGCADTAGRPSCRTHSADANSRRTTPSVRSDLISDRDRPVRCSIPRLRIA